MVIAVSGNTLGAMILPQVFEYFLKQEYFSIEILYYVIAAIMALLGLTGLIIPESKNMERYDPQESESLKFGKISERFKLGKIIEHPKIRFEQSKKSQSKMDSSILSQSKIGSQSDISLRQVSKYTGF